MVATFILSVIKSVSELPAYQPSPTLASIWREHYLNGAHDNFNYPQSWRYQSARDKGNRAAALMDAERRLSVRDRLMSLGFEFQLNEYAGQEINAHV